MKKMNSGYVAVCLLIPITVCVACFAAGWIFVHSAPQNVVLGLWLGGLFGFTGVIWYVPRLMSRYMEKKGAELEADFEHHFQFVAHNAIFYIDTGGRLGVLWRGNPFAIQLADLRGLTDIRTNDGKMLGGTSLVRCQFKLDGKRHSISAFRLYGGKRYSMKSDLVLEAISKADKIGEMLNAAKDAALYGADADRQNPGYREKAEGVSVWDVIHGTSPLSDD